MATFLKDPKDKRFGPYSFMNIASSKNKNEKEDIYLMPTNKKEADFLATISDKKDPLTKKEESKLNVDGFTRSIKYCPDEKLCGNKYGILEIAERYQNSVNTFFERVITDENQRFLMKFNKCKVGEYDID